MREISDLTKDNRQTLEEMLSEAIHDTLNVDRQKDNNDSQQVEYENSTFYYRSIYLFMQRAILYYTHEELSNWSRRELLKEIVLPKIKGYQKTT